MSVGNPEVLHLNIAPIPHDGAAPATLPSSHFSASDRLARLGAAALLSLLLGVLAGCSGSSAGLPVYKDGAEMLPGDPAYATTVQVRYLGAGGVVIKRGDDVVLTAPFFSNPSIPRVAFGEIRSLHEQVDRFVKPGDDYLAAAQAILVGHSHYDHLMDVPYIKTKYMPAARIYGNTTMTYILAGDPALNPADMISVENEMGTSERAGKWWPAGPHIRFMALKSEHAPIFAGISFFEGNYDAPLKAIPTRATGWLEGQTLAYLIDFLGADGKVAYRIHYQDAASNPPLGFPPPLASLDDARPVDLALVCMPGSNEVRNYPDGLLARFSPRHIVLIHWENFFETLPDDASQLRTVPHEPAEKFLEHLQAVAPGIPYTLPAPGAWMRFSP